MYSQIEIRHFRCFKALVLSNIARVNLIAGVNNSGKTALLEALFLHCGAYNPGLTLQLNAMRGMEKVHVSLRPVGESPWDSLFERFDVSEPIVLIGHDLVNGPRTVRIARVVDPDELSRMPPVKAEVAEAGDQTASSAPVFRMLRLEYEHHGRRSLYHLIVDRTGVRVAPAPPPPPFPAYFQGTRARLSFQEGAELFGNLEIRGQQGILTETLKIIEPRLQRLSMVVAAGEPVIHGDIGIGRLVPLPVMGEGMGRLAALILHIANAPGGVLLVDEIENGLHHSVLPFVWRAVRDAARKFDTQVFATTHSLECIQAAHAVFSESKEYDFRLHRLELADGSSRAVSYDREVLEAALDSGLEVR